MVSVWYKCTRFIADLPVVFRPTPEKRYNSYDLYSHLSDEGQNGIKRNTCPENKGNFDIELKIIGNGFEIIRYITECRGMIVDAIFLYNLMRSLAGISKCVVEQLSMR